MQGWLRRGGWVVVATGTAVAAVIATTVEPPPHYEALSRPAAPSDALPVAVVGRWTDAIAPGSPRLLGTDAETAYYIAAPAQDPSGLCFIAANLSAPELSQGGCSSPGTNGGFQFADVALSDHKPGRAWVEIAEDVWRDTAFE